MLQYIAADRFQQLRIMQYSIHFNPSDHSEIVTDVRKVKSVVHDTDRNRH